MERFVFFYLEFLFSFRPADTLDLLLLLIPGAILISGEHQILIKGHDLLEDSRSDIFSVHGTVNKCWQKPGKAVGEEFDLETSSIATKFSVLCLEPQANLDQDDRSATLGLLAYTGLHQRFSKKKSDLAVSWRLSETMFASRNPASKW